MAGLFSMIKSNEYLFLCARSVTCVQAVNDFLCESSDLSANNRLSN